MQSTRMALVAICVLVAITLIVWIAVYQEDRRGILTISFLDVGQGDAIFIDAPNGTQVLIDGGSGTSVLRRLSEIMPWYDRSIDVVIGTHPDMDHIGGLIDMLPRYRTKLILKPSVVGDTSAWQTYLDEITNEEMAGARSIVAMRGDRIDLGGAYLEILFPDRPVPGLETNTGCIISRLVYGDTAFMLSCDAPQAIEKYLVMLDGDHLRSNILKAGHHGSKTSSAEIFVEAVEPDIVVYSRGCDNTYGHPSTETIDLFARLHIPTLDTCTDGSITFTSDGREIKRK